MWAHVWSTSHYKVKSKGFLLQLFSNSLTGGGSKSSRNTEFLLRPSVIKLWCQLKLNFSLKSQIADFYFISMVRQSTEFSHGRWKCNWLVLYTKPLLLPEMGLFEHFVAISNFLWVIFPQKKSCAFSNVTTITGWGGTDKNRLPLLQSGTLDQRQPSCKEIKPELIKMQIILWHWVIHKSADVLRKQQLFPQRQKTATISFNKHRNSSTRWAKSSPKFVNDNLKCWHLNKIQHLSDVLTKHAAKMTQINQEVKRSSPQSLIFFFWVGCERRGRLLTERLL